MSGGWRTAGSGLDQGGDRRVAAQLVQAPAAGGPDAADRYAQFGADLCIRHGRILDEHGEQPLTAGSQTRERLAQRCLTLGFEQSSSPITVCSSGTLSGTC